MTGNPATTQDFTGRIAFRPSADKLAACLCFLRLARPDQPGSAPLDPGTVLLLAEATHLSAYGRPLTGCMYNPVDGGWRPELLLEAEVAEARRMAEHAGRNMPVAEAFPDLSRSDMEHILKAADDLTADPAACRYRISRMLHNGRPDYALMLVEDDAGILAAKLEDLAVWSKHFYLGRPA